MGRLFKHKFLALLLLCPLLLGGCLTSMVVGAIAGVAAAGWGAVKYSEYKAAQVRSPHEDQQLYGLAASVDTPQIKLHKGISTPNLLKPGESVMLSMDYSVQLPANMNAASVSESWILKKDGKVLAELPPQKGQRTAGGWSADATVPIPKNASPGTYVVEHRIQTGANYDTGESTFVVAG